MFQVTGVILFFYLVSTPLIKLSIIYFYRRIFLGRVFELCSRTLIALSILLLVWGVVTWLFYCGTDIRANFEGPWDNCPDWGFQAQMGVFILDSIIDVCILILPIPLVCIPRRLVTAAEATTEWLNDIAADLETQVQRFVQDIHHLHLLPGWTVSTN
jgi:hypothetical protein